MEKNTIILLAVVAVVVVAVGIAVVLTGDDQSEEEDTAPIEPDVPDVPVGPSEPETITCKDLSGKTVVMPKNVESMYLIGAGTLRTISHLGLAEKVCGSDQTARGATYGSNTYMYAYDDHFNKIKDNSGQRGVVNLEEILTCNFGQKPQVLVIVEYLSEENANTIESIKKAGIAVFEILTINNPIDENGEMHPDYIRQLSCMGEAFGVEKRANELINGYKEMIKEIKDLGQNGGDAYLGGLTVSRSRGLNHTDLEYPPFVLTGMKNIADGKTSSQTGKFGGTMLKPEELISIINDSPDFKMFVDPAGWRLEKGLCSSDVIISAALANKGVSNGLIITPISSYGAEFDNILVDGYLVAGYMNGLDQNMIREKIDAVYELFYGDKAVNSDGKKLYDEMTDWYYNATHCRFGQLVTFRTDGIVMTDGTFMKL